MDSETDGDAIKQQQQETTTINKYENTDDTSNLQPKRMKLCISGEREAKKKKYEKPRQQTRNHSNIN